MTGESKEIEQLKAQVERLQATTKLVLAMNQALSEVAQSLCATHSDPAGLLAALDVIEEAADGPLLYSEATEHDLQLLAQARNAVRVQLMSSQINTQK